MLLILGAIALGMVIGAVTGGSVSRLASLRLRWWGLVFVGLGLQLVPGSWGSKSVGHAVGVALLVGSYVVLLGFVVANLKLPGFWLIAVGFALNALVIGVNGGMPVNRTALRQATGAGYRESVAKLRQDGGAKHHLIRADDDLVWLGDVVPVGWPERQVLSTGDVVWLAGTAWLMARAMYGTKPVGAGPRRRRLALPGSRPRRRQARREAETPEA